MNIQNLQTGIIIQVRTGSSRLPQKMILPFYKDKSILEILIERFKKELKFDIPFVVATTDKTNDDSIQKICDNEQVDCFRGPEDDVLLRFIQASENFSFDYIIRICADNPLMDIAGTLDLLNNKNIGSLDYLAYKTENGFPSIMSHLGFWGELVSLSALKLANQSTKKKLFREHVTNYIYQHPESFQVKLFKAPDNLGGRDDIRLTVDTQSDFNLVQDIYTKLINQKLAIIPANIINFLDRNPGYMEIMKDQIKQNKK